MFDVLAWHESGSLEQVQQGGAFVKTFGVGRSSSNGMYVARYYCSCFCIVLDEESESFYKQNLRLFVYDDVKLGSALLLGNRRRRNHHLLSNAMLCYAGLLKLLFTSIRVICFEGYD